MNDRRLAIVQVTPELLRQVLGLPADARILDARFSFDTRAVELKVAHPDFAPVELGCAAPTVAPRFASVEKFHWFRRLRTVKFLGWGQ